ncbi:MAG: response regulator [Verrucomicrobiota bacterium]
MARSTLLMIEDEILLCELFADYVVTIPDVEFLGCENDGASGVAKALEAKPDIVVLDMRLPKVNGIEALHQLRAALPTTKLIVFTGTLKEETLRLAKQEGADAFVEKAQGLGELKKAILAVLAGDRFISPGVADILRDFRA